MPQLNVLVTCVGGHYGIDIIDSIRADRNLNARVVGVDGNSSVTNRYFADAFHQVPLASSEPDRFTDSLLEICRRESIDVVIPGADEEVWALSQATAEFERAGARCAVMDFERVDLIRDKARFLDRAKAAGVPVPRYAAISNAEQFEDAVTSLGYPNSRVVVKPRIGRGARGVVIVDSAAGDQSVIPEARGYELGTAERISKKLRLSPPAPNSLLAMEYLPGAIYDVDCLALNGRVECIVPRERLWDTPFSRGVEGHRVVTHAEIERITRSIAELLSLSFLFDCDFGTAADGSPGLLEVNPRWSGSVTTARAAGINLPSLLVRLMVGMPIAMPQLEVGVEVFPVTRMAFRKTGRAALVGEPGL
ncbi:MAG: ATP-grasp domain-containing protein [Verrucomicrobia bacterium]|nr:ATP-grasp domain-containing protein [Verrucomicrobiota bacterium]